MAYEKQFKITLVANSYAIRFRHISTRISHMLEEANSNFDIDFRVESIHEFPELLGRKVEDQDTTEKATS